MRKTLLYGLFFLLPALAVAQKTQDVLYLRDGSIIRGSIVEKNDTLVRILTFGSNVFAYRPDQILVATREEIPKQNVVVKETGFFHIFSAGFLFGSSDADKPAPFSLMAESFYKCRKNYATGIFLGFEQLKENTVPVGVTFKYLLPVKRSSVVFGLSGGYGNPVEDPKEEYIIRMKGGPVCGAEIGFHLPIGQGNGYFASVGYRYSELNYDVEDWWLGDSKRKIQYNRLLIRTGISFF